VDDVGPRGGIRKIFGVFPPFGEELELGADTPEAETDEVPHVVGKGGARSKKVAASALDPLAFCQLIFRPVLWPVPQVVQRPAECA